jgi:GT2 family glycosyltransferase
VSDSPPADMATEPAPVTVVVVNCNGGAETLRCLRSVAGSTPPPDRFVLVDNGSTDGTRALIENEYKGQLPLTYIELSSNVGPAAARNIGAQNVRSAYIAFLDNDTVVCSTWLTDALESMSTLHADCVQCKLLLGSDSNRLDSLGYLLGPFGFPRHIVRPGALDMPEYQRPRLLFGVKSAAMVITRQAFERAGGFDPEFFIYGEETDLCWRVLRCGGTIALAPQSIVRHFSGGTRRFLPRESDALLYRGGTRNYLRMVAKNSPPRRLVLDVAGQIAIWLGLAAFQAARGRVQAAALILRGILDGVAMLPSIASARRRSPLPYLDVPRELRMRFNMRYLWRIVKAI